MSNRKLILYVAACLDGYIAGEDNDLGWLSMVEQKGGDYGYHEFIKTVDTIIMGRKTYDVALSFGVPFPHKGRTCYVLSNSRSGADENVTYYGGDVKTLINEIREKDGKHIFCVGGPEVVFQLTQENLIDRYIISIIPILLGRGVALKKAGSNIHCSLCNANHFHPAWCSCGTKGKKDN